MNIHVAHVERGTLNGYGRNVIDRGNFHIDIFERNFRCRSRAVKRCHGCDIYATVKRYVGQRNVALTRHVAVKRNILQRNRAAAYVVIAVYYGVFFTVRPDERYVFISQIDFGKELRTGADYNFKTVLFLILRDTFKRFFQSVHFHTVHFYRSRSIVLHRFDAEVERTVYGIHAPRQRDFDIFHDRRVGALLRTQLRPILHRLAAAG